jgi:hypothetical protein
VKNAYIKFDSHEDRILGSYELVTNSHFTYLSNDIFCVPWSSLATLDGLQIKYTFATEEALTNAQPIWNVAETRSR